MNITMKPDEEINKEKWWLLQELKKEWLLIKNGNKIRFVLRDSIDKDVPSLERQEKLLNNLAEWSNSTTEFGNCIDLKVEMGFYLVTIIPLNFNTIYRIYESMHAKGEEHQTKSKEESENHLLENIVAGYLVYNTDGGIYFKDKLIKMRSQMETLCILFMK